MKVSRRSDIDPFRVMQVMKAADERARTHGDVLHLEVGQPSTPAPASARATAAAALGSDRLGYTAALGIPELRSAIARHHADWYGDSVDPERVAVTVGASGGFVLALLAAFDVGDRVAITEPGYAAYRNIIRALGLELVGIPIDASTRFVLTPELLEQAGPLDGVVVASPSNPTGTTMTMQELEAVVTWCGANGVRVISDEIYHGITYDHPAVTALGFNDSVIVVQSFSKYFSMTGWRVGWNVVPPELVDPVERLAQNLFISPPAIAQHAAIGAFDGHDELTANVSRYAESRLIIGTALDDLGWSYAPPDGAFYVWLDIAPTGLDAETLSRAWLADIGVAVTPGTDFDPVAGRHFVRVSYSESPVDIATAMERITVWADR